MRDKTIPRLLSGEVFDPTGEALYAHGGAKRGRSYSYYVSRSLVRGFSEK
jgi:hypothetical protein